MMSNSNAGWPKYISTANPRIIEIEDRIRIRHDFHFSEGSRFARSGGSSAFVEVCFGLLVNANSEVDDLALCRSSFISKYSPPEIKEFNEERFADESAMMSFKSVSCVNGQHGVFRVFLFLTDLPVQFPLAARPAAPVHDSVFAMSKLKNMRIDFAFQKQKEGIPLATAKSKTVVTSSKKEALPVDEDVKEHNHLAPTAIADIFGDFGSKLPPFERVTSPDKSSVPIKRQKITLPTNAPHYDRHSLLHWEDADDIEVVLRKWDLDLKYGPCIGLSRLERWERAKKLGLNPPDYVHKILTAAADDSNIEPAQPDSLWAHV